MQHNRLTAASGDTPVVQGPSVERQLLLFQGPGSGVAGVLTSIQLSPLAMRTRTLSVLAAHFIAFYTPEDARHH